MVGLVNEPLHALVEGCERVPVEPPTLRAWPPMPVVVSRLEIITTILAIT